MRWHKPSSSFISEEIMMQAMPCGGEFLKQMVNLFFGADVDASRRFIHDQHLRRDLEPFCEQDFLLIAPGEGRDGISQ